jgi:hypothetical protein
MSQRHASVSLSRRALLAWPGALLSCRRPVPAEERIVRVPIGSISHSAGFLAPLTLGMARVVLRPGAASWAATPGGVRLISVETGELAVGLEPASRVPTTAAELAAAKAPPDPDEKLFLPAGTVMTFAAQSVASVRNAGSRPVVILDVVVYHDDPRPLSRAFTADGVSFQLLASASASEAPDGAATVTLERVRLGSGAALPADLCRGLTLLYLAAGMLRLRARRGAVAMARAAAAAPYAMPGALEVLDPSETRDVTAGGVVFSPLDGIAAMSNTGSRTVELLALTVRETA